MPVYRHIRPTTPSPGFIVKDTDTAIIPGFAAISGSQDLTRALGSVHLCALVLLSMICPLTTGEVEADTGTPNTEQTGAEPRSQPKVRVYQLTGSTRHVFDSDIDQADGSVQTTVFETGLGVDAPLTDRASFGAHVKTGVRDYDFDGGTGLSSAGRQPWGAARSLGLNASITYQRSEQLWLFAGVNGSTTGEDGAEFDQTLTGGGSLGAFYKFSQSLTLGLGVTVQSRLEDDPLILPFPTVNWLFSDTESGQWRLRIGGSGRGVTSIVGAGVTFSPSDELSFTGGVGLSGLGDEFRLDKDGPVPNGVARDEAIPLLLGLDWKPTRSFQLGAFVGASLARDLELLDEAGDTVGEVDVDTAPILGATLRWQL